jgi:hypothetical protein
VSETPDYESAYRDLRLRVTDVLRLADRVALDAVAPATPEWRVRDVAAHLAGVCDDVVHGRMADVAATGSLLVEVNRLDRVNDWTDAQVARRAEWSIDRVLDDWAEQAVQVEATMNALHPAIGQMVVDAVTHEHDIRGGLGTPGARDSAAMVIAVTWLLHPLSKRLKNDDLGTLRIEHEGGVVELGAGTPVTQLSTTRFEIVRAVTGRRSMAQIDAMGWNGPLDSSVLILASELFPPRTTNLVE